jgi:hypothetical protein
MKTSPEAVYREGVRRLQDRFGTRRVAHRRDGRLALLAGDDPARIS